jgi:hypothetical protein
MPVGVQFDPRVPGEIRDEYVRTLRRKRVLLGVALAMSLLGAGLVAVTLFAGGMAEGKRSPDLRAYERDVRGGRVLAVMAHLPIATKLEVSVRGAGEKGGAGWSKTFQARTGGSGDFDMIVPLEGTADTYTVAIEWEDGEGLVTSLRRTVSPGGA